jgi:hypothetical protein
MGTCAAGWTEGKWSEAPPAGKRVIAADQLFAVFIARMLYDRKAESSEVGAKYAGYFDAWPSGDELVSQWSAKDRAAIAMPIVSVEVEYETVKRELLEKRPDLFGSPIRPAYSKERLTRAYSLMRSRVLPSSLGNP